MLNLINKLNTIIQTVLVVFIVAFLIVAGIVIYNRYIKKRSRAKIDNVDYSGLRRMDSIDYLKFDDIVDDMIVVEHGTRYIASIQCTGGFDFHTANFSEKLAVKNAYTNFIGMQKNPFTYRQSCHKVRVEDDINRFYEHGERIKKELVALRGTHGEMSRLYEALSKEEPVDTEKLEMLSEQLDDIEKQIETRQWRIEHIADQIDYLSLYSDSDNILERTESYQFDWTYNALDYPVDLTKEEIREKAKIGLGSIADSFIHALSDAKIKAVRMDSDDIVQMFRSQFHPVTAELYDENRIRESSYYEDIVSADSHDEIYNGAVEELTLTMQEAVIAQAKNEINEITGGESVDGRNADREEA